MPKSPAPLPPMELVGIAKPGDVVVFRVPDRLNTDALERFSELMMGLERQYAGIRFLAISSEGVRITAINAMVGATQ